jgi:hypothetical protein
MNGIIANFNWLDCCGCRHFEQDDGCQCLEDISVTLDFIGESVLCDQFELMKEIKSAQRCSKAREGL